MIDTSSEPSQMRNPYRPQSNQSLELDGRPRTHSGAKHFVTRHGHRTYGRALAEGLVLREIERLEWLRWHDH